MDKGCLIISKSHGAIYKWVVEFVDESGGHQITLQHHLSMGLNDMLRRAFSIGIHNCHETPVTADIANHERTFHFLHFCILIANPLS